MHTRGFQVVEFRVLVLVEYNLGTTYEDAGGKLGGCQSTAVLGFVIVVSHASPLYPLPKGSENLFKVLDAYRAPASQRRYLTVVYEVCDRSKAVQRYCLGYYTGYKNCSFGESIMYYY